MLWTLSMITAPDITAPDFTAPDITAPDRCSLAAGVHTTRSTWPGAHGHTLEHRTDPISRIEVKGKQVYHQEGGKHTTEADG